jgi:DNA-binding CsgD family transcriptional regulator/PAS domain-containing protein
MYSEDTLLRLIERIYDAALAPGRWPEFLEALADLIDGHVVNLALTNPTLTETAMSFAVRFDPEAQRLYHEHYCVLDPWAKVAIKRGLLRTGVVGLGGSLIEQHELERTEFYNDFGRRFGIMGGVTAVIRADPALTATLNSSQRQGGRQFDESELLLLRRLLPHLQRAFQVHERLSGVAAARIAAEDVLDRVPFGVVLVDASGRAVLVNAAAQQILDARDGLTLRDKMLVTASVPQTTELRALVAGAIAASRGDPLPGCGGALAIGRPSLKRPLQALVTPLRVAGTVFSLSAAAPSAAVFISDPELQPLTNDAILRQFFGLTPAETRLASLLLQQKSVEEAAEILRISLNTARTYMKKLFEKTGTRRQSELVRLLGGGVGQLRRCAAEVSLSGDFAADIPPGSKNPSSR